MGYRCPRCKEDFGNDKAGLWKHFEEYEMCRFEASAVFIERLNNSKKEVKEEK